MNTRYYYGTRPTMNVFKSPSGSWGFTVMLIDELVASGRNFPSQRAARAAAKLKRDEAIRREEA